MGRAWGHCTRSECSGCFCFQLTPVMVQPQRGQSDPVPDRQVVPQLEHVLAADAEVQPQLRFGAVLPQA